MKRSQVKWEPNQDSHSRIRASDVPAEGRARARPICPGVHFRREGCRDVSGYLRSDLQLPPLARKGQCQGEHPQTPGEKGTPSTV